MNKPTQAALVCGVAASLVLLAGTRLVYAQDPGTTKIVEVQQTSEKAGAPITIQDVAPSGTAVAVRADEDIRLKNRLARLDRKRERLLARARATKSRYSVRADQPAQPVSGVALGQATAPSGISERGVALEVEARRLAKTRNLTIADDRRAKLRSARAGRQVETARSARLSENGVPFSNEVEEGRAVEAQRAQAPRVLSTGNRVEFAVPAQLATPRSETGRTTNKTRMGQAAEMTAPRSSVAETAIAMPATAPMAPMSTSRSYSSSLKVRSGVAPQPKTVIKQATVVIYEDGSTVIVGGTVQAPTKAKTSVKKPSTKRAVKPKK